MGLLLAPGWLPAPIEMRPQVRLGGLVVDNTNYLNYARNWIFSEFTPNRLVGVCGSPLNPATPAHNQSRPPRSRAPV